MCDLPDRSFVSVTQTVWHILALEGSLKKFERGIGQSRMVGVGDARIIGHWGSCSDAVRGQWTGSSSRHLLLESAQRWTVVLIESVQLAQIWKLIQAVVKGVVSGVLTVVAQLAKNSNRISRDSTFLPVFASIRMLGHVLNVWIYCEAIFWSHKTTY